MALSDSTLETCNVIFTILILDKAENAQEALWPLDTNHDNAHRNCLFSSLREDCGCRNRNNLKKQGFIMTFVER